MNQPFERKRVPITEETVLTEIPERHLGACIIDLPEGAALCTDALSLTLITAADRDSGEQFMVVIGVAEHGGRNLGSLTPMSPDEARSFANTLIQTAADVEAANGGACV